MSFSPVSSHRVACRGCGGLNSPDATDCRLCARPLPSPGREAEACELASALRDLLDRFEGRTRPPPSADTLAKRARAALRKHGG